MRKLVSRAGYSKLIRKLAKNRLDLEEAKRRMGEAGEGGEWHENNPFEQAEEQVHILTSRLKSLLLEVAESAIVAGEAKTDYVTFGSKVTLEIDGRIKKYKILGDPDTNLSRQVISYLSPVGIAIFNRKLGEEIDAETPGGIIRIKIIDIEVK